VLAMALSDDGGRTFPYSRNLEQEDADSGDEFS
jgi:hypothetical protein